MIVPGSATGVPQTCRGRVGSSSFHDRLLPGGWTAGSGGGRQRRNWLHYSTHERRTKKRRCRQPETQEKIKSSIVSIAASAVLVKQKAQVLRNDILTNCRIHDINYQVSNSFPAIEARTRNPSKLYLRYSPRYYHNYHII